MSFKNFCFLIILLSFINCSSDEENIRFEILPFESISFPESFVQGETYDIVYTYKIPTTCHAHDGIIFNRQNETRILHVQNVVQLRGDCVNLDNQIVERTFKLQALQDQAYIFKYYLGKDSDGDLMYEEVLVPVQ